MLLFVKSRKDVWKLLSGALKRYFIVEKSQVMMWHDGFCNWKSYFGGFFFLIEFLLFFSVCILTCSPNCLCMQRLTLPVFLARGTTSLSLVMNKELWNVSTDVFTHYISESVFSKACVFFS